MNYAVVRGMIADNSIISDERSIYALDYVIAVQKFEPRDLRHGLTRYISTSYSVRNLSKDYLNRLS